VNSSIKIIIAEKLTIPTISCITGITNINLYIRECGEAHPTVDSAAPADWPTSHARAIIIYTYPARDLELYYVVPKV
jgi:hypothetical protein